MKRNIILLFILQFSYFGYSQNYQDYSNNWYYTEFLVNEYASGGGNVSLQISNDILTVSLNAGFEASPMKLGPVVNTESPSQLPNLYLGIINNSDYKIRILNNFLIIESDTQPLITNFYVTEFTIDLNNPSSWPEDTSSPDLENIVMPYLTDDQNYVHKIQPKVPTQEFIVGSTIPANHTVTYIDELARDKQKIAIAQSPMGKDQLLHIEYDNFGRQTKRYLPSPTTTQDNGSYINADEAILLTTNYYQNTFGDNNVYSERVIEKSPLNRILEQGSVGSTWSLVEDDNFNKSLRVQYLTNTGNDEVKNFNVIHPSNDRERTTLSYDGLYAPSKLKKTIVKDKNWVVGEAYSRNHTHEEFSDGIGRVILKRKFNDDEILDTYYVYDDFGELTYVIPPLASNQIIDYGNQGFRIASQINHPWVNLVSVDSKFAKDYNRQLSEYNNEDILNVDLNNEYNGTGGYTVTTFDNDELLTMSISFSTNQPLEIKKGVLTSLKEYGNFKDAELGQIKGAGYSYVFYIKNNQIIAEGGGKISTLNFTMNNNTKLLYTNNYPWTTFTDIDKKVIASYETKLKEYDNSEILNIYIDNEYGGQGGVHVEVDSNDNIALTFNFSSTSGVKLRNGVLFSLNLKRQLDDRDLGTISVDGTDYHLSLKSNNVILKSDGALNVLTSFNGYTFSPPNPPPPDTDELTVEGLCYIYHHDKRNRLIEKKIPGKEWEYIVYDKLNRPILIQDANLRLENKWLFNKYDVFSRTTYNGIYNYAPTQNNENSGRIELQSIVNNQLNAIWYENKLANESNIGILYSNSSFPIISSSDEILKVNFYDTYAGIDATDISLNLGTTVFDDEITGNVKGLKTGSDIKVLGTNHWIKSLSYYDSKARPVYVASENSFLNATDIIKVDFDFIGKEIENETRHYKDNNEPIRIANKFNYDNSGRFLSHSQTIAGQDSELITNNTYNEIGQLTSKQVGGKVTISPEQTYGIQQIDYEYNINGWLKTINQGAADNGDLFGLKINYDAPEHSGVDPQYNGNISELYWQTANDNILRSYDFDYDALNRLKRGNYMVNNSNNESYNLENVNYDLNGNIVSLQRMGLVSSTNQIDLIDDLSYNYELNSNKLKSISDTGFADGFMDGNTNDPEDADYEYDLNGNMTRDHNKGLFIYYNHLNLPTNIYVGNDQNSGIINFTYDALGKKLQKEVINSGGNIVKTKYAGSFIYRNYNDGNGDKLKYSAHPEGYMEPITSTNNFNYVYQIKDHLDNIRLTYDLDDEASILINQDFTNGTYDWSLPPTNLGYINNLNQQLNIVLKNTGLSTIKDIMGIAPNDNIHLEFDFLAESMESTLLKIEQFLNGAWQPINGTNTFNLNDGHFDLDFTIQGSGVRLGFVKGTGDDNGLLTTCLVDNIVFVQNSINILEEKNYYPFGLEHKGYNYVTSSNANEVATNFMYNGKEMNADLGVNLYDYGARFYDPATGRWFSIDNLAEKYYSDSPFGYALNNPIIYIDPDGNEVWMCCEGLKRLWREIKEDLFNDQSYEIEKFKRDMQAVKQTIKDTDFVVAVGAKADVGLHAKVKPKIGPAKFNVDLNYMTAKLGEAKFDLTEMFSDDEDAFTYDYIFKDGEVDITQGVKISGDVLNAVEVGFKGGQSFTIKDGGRVKNEKTDWGVVFGPKFGNDDKPSEPSKYETLESMKLLKKPNESFDIKAEKEFIGLDFGFEGAFIFGFGFSIQIGINL